MTYEEMQALSDDQIVALFNDGVQSVVVGKQWWIDELVRRRQDRATDGLVELTRVLTRLTWVLVILGGIAAVASVAAAVFAAT